MKQFLHTTARIQLHGKLGFKLERGTWEQNSQNSLAYNTLVEGKSCCNVDFIFGKVPAYNWIGRIERRTSYIDDILAYSLVHLPFLSFLCWDMPEHPSDHCCPTECCCHGERTGECHGSGK